MRDINIPSYTGDAGLNGDEKAGALIGCADDQKDNIVINNTYYKEGNNYIGRGLNESDFGAYPVTKDEFYVGAITYKLNTYAETPKDYFGQPVDDLNISNGKHIGIPLPGIDAKIYKDEYSSKEVYSNFNPRTTKIHRIKFFKDNVNLNPDIAYVDVRDGDDFSFELTSQGGYEIDKVLQKSEITSKTKELAAVDNFNLNQVLVNVGKELDINLDEIAKKDEFFSSLFGDSFSEEAGDADNGVKKYIVENVTSDLEINITTKKYQAIAPAGLGTIGQPFILTCAAELDWLNQELSKGGNNKIYADINNDIDYNGRTWIPICPYKEGLAFKGVINGKGHTISNLDIANNNIGNNQGAFFIGIDGGQINNLTLSGKFNSAAFAYSARNATFNHCTAKGSIDSTNRYCGGIAAVACEKSDFISCVNEASITHNSQEQNAATGGILGSIDSPEYITGDSDFDLLKIKFTDCYNYGSISANDSSYDNHAGGIVGLIDNVDSIKKYNDSSIEITKCVNAANISDSQNNLTAGGIVSWISDCKCKVKIIQCINNGNIGYSKTGEKSSVQTSGGILGCWNNSCNAYDSAKDAYKVTISQCVTNGNIWAYGDEAGGFVGCLNKAVNESYIYIDNSASLGFVSSDDIAGSILGGTGDFVWNSWNDAFNFKNSYFLKYDGLDAAGGNLWFGDTDWNVPGKIEHITTNQIESGELTFKLNRNNNIKEKSSFTSDEFNENYGDDIFGQNVDTSSKYFNNQTLSLQNRPMLISDTCLPVYFNYGYLTDKNVEYTNIKPPVESSSDFVDLNITTEGPGNVLGLTKMLKNSNNVFYIQPDPGCDFDKENVTYNGNKLEVASNNAIVINPNNNASKHNLNISFRGFKEPSLSSKKDYKYEVNNFLELNYISKLVNEGKDISFELGSDIVIDENVDYKSIGKGSHPFKSKFNGNGYTITNNTSTPIFGTLQDATIYNLNINLKVQSGYKAALAFKSVNSSITSVHTSGSVVPDTSSFAGMICEIEGRNSADSNTYYTTTFTNCTNSIINIPVRFKNDDYPYIGGFVSVIYGGAVNFTDCTNRGKVCSIEDKEHKYFVGGFVGACIDDVRKINFSSCYNKGEIFGTKGAAGFIALLKSSCSSKADRIVTIENCINSGNIKSFDVAAGFVAYCNKVDYNYRLTIKNSENSGNIRSIYWDSDFDGDVAAGIYGYADDEDLTVEIENCVVSSTDIYADGECVAGVFGDCNSVANMHITNCFVCVGKLHNDGKKSKGVILGNLDDRNSTVSDNYYLSENCTQIYGDEPNQSNNNMLIDKKKLASGYYAYFLSNITDNNKKITNLGQGVDLQGYTLEPVPHIDSPAVYCYNFSDSIVKYSNYDSESVQKYKGQFFIVPQAVPGSSIAEVEPVYIFSNSGQHSVSFKPKDATSVLEYVRFFIEGIGTSKKITYDGINGNAYVFTLENIIDSFDNYDKSKDEIKAGIINNKVNLLYNFSSYRQPAGDGSVNNPMHVKTPQELNYISKYVESAWAEDVNGNKHYTNNGNDKINIVLDNDIDLANIDWTPIGLRYNFYGSFDGRNYTIKNLKSSTGGLFGNAKNAIIKNIKLEVDCTLNSSDEKSFGTLINIANSCYIKNISVSGIICGSSFDTFGGIVGTLYGKSKIENNIEQRDYDSNFNEGSRVYDCTSNLVMSFSNINSRHRSGGIVGYLDSDSSVFIDNCVNKSNLQSNLSQNGCSEFSDWASGIIAVIPSQNATVKVYNCINTGSITGLYASGICSDISSVSIDSEAAEFYSSEVDFKNNINKGLITGKYAGGIISTIFDLMIHQKLQVNIESCSNQGSIDSYDCGFAGGIVSRYSNKYANLSICNCSNIGAVSSDEGNGAGIIGDCESSIEYFISNCFNIGKISSKSKKNASNYIFPIGKFDIRYGNCQNCYFLNEDSQWDDSFNIDQKIMSVSEADVKNGNLCVNLCNSNQNEKNDSKFAFGQIIDKYDCEKKDDYPVIGSPYKVYPVSGSNDMYTNWKDGKIWLLSIQTNNYGSVKIVRDDGSLFNLDSENIYLPSTRDVKIVCVPHDKCVLEQIQICDNDGNTVKDKNKEIAGQTNINSIDILDNVVSFNQVVDNYTLKVDFSNVATPSFTQNTEGNVIDCSVSSYLELAWVANRVNNPENSNEIINVNLVNNISVVSSGICSWPGIGTNKHPFKGTFNGNDYTISGISMYDKDVDQTAFIRFAKNASIKNLKLENLSIYGSTKAAGLVYSAENCHIWNITVSGEIRSSGKAMGGIVGELSGGSKGTNNNPVLIENCVNKTSMSEGKDRAAKVGGIVGVINNGCYCNIKSCKNYGNVYSNGYSTGVSKQYDDYAGGIVGYVYGSGKSDKTSTELLLESCQNCAVVKGNIAGGMLATVDGNDNAAQKTDLLACTNYGKVCGDHCGGMVGLIDDCTDNSHLNLTKCMNLGYIGTTCGVLKNAGGLLGMTDDRNLEVNINSSINLGPVYNLAKSGTGTSKTINGVTTSLSIWAGIGTIGMIAALSNPGGWVIASIAFLAFGSATGFIGSLQGIIEERLSTNQYAGGICAQFNHYSKINMNNVINYTMVSGTSYEGPITADWSRFDTTVRNVFAVGNSNKIGYQSSYVSAKDNTDNSDLKDLDSFYKKKNNSSDTLGEVRDASAFSSGEIGFRIQQLEHVLDNSNIENPNIANFGQIIDKLSEGSKMFVPEFDVKNTVSIYRYSNKDKSNTHYSNFDEDTNEHFKANIMFKNTDDTSPVDIDKINFEIKASGDQSINLKSDTSDTDTIASFDVRKGELFHGKIKPKYYDQENTSVESSSTSIKKFDPYSIYDINIQSTGDKFTVDNEEVVYNSDGTFTKYINPKFEYVKDTTTNEDIKIYNSYAFKIDYALDGSVEISTMESIQEDLMFEIKTFNNPIQVHNFGNEQHPTILFPWDSKDSLPDKSNNFYLINDVELSQEYVAEEGNTKLCLNGHSIKFVNKGCVKINKDSNFNIDDCNESNSVYTYKVNDNNFEIQKISEETQEKASTTQNDDNQTPTSTSEGNKSQDSEEQNDNIIIGSTIFANSLDKSNTCMFINNGGSINIYKTNILKPVETTLISYKNYSQSLSSYIGCNIFRPVYSAPTLLVNPAPIAVFDCFIDNGQFTIGKDFNIYNVDKENNIDINFQDVDFQINSIKSNIGTDEEDLWKTDYPCIIGFDNDYVFNHTFTINAKVNHNVILTSGFDSFIKQGIDYKNVFKILDNSDYDIALINDGKYFNELTICKSNLICTICVDKEGSGNVFPFGEVNYIRGSKAYFHYQSESSNVLTYVTDIKISASNQKVECSQKEWSKNTSNKIEINLEKDQELKKEVNDIYCQSGDYVSNLYLKLFDYQGQTMSSDDFLTINSKIIFRFTTLTQIMTNPKNGWTDINSTSILPDKDSDNAQPLGYKLKADIHLTQPWVCPVGSFTIDLNGHSIIQDVNNMNAIIVDNEKSNLAIIDSCPNTRQCFRRDSNGRYITCTQDNLDSLEVHGGLITGTNFTPDRYYKYEINTGAVVVNNGTFILHSGTIAGNNVNELNGSAGIVVGENGYVDICKDARICFNSINGDPDYVDKLFGAGIASYGTVVNEGSIDNNYANNPGASGVAVLAGKFENKGCISNNHSTDTNKCSDYECYGAVYNTGYFVNSGSINMNTSDFVCPAIFNIGTLALSGDSQIFNNSYCNYEQLNSTVYDIEDASKYAIEILSALTTKIPSVISSVKSNTLTNKWNLAACSIENVFKKFASSKTGNEVRNNGWIYNNNKDKELALSTDGEVAFVDKQDVVDVVYTVNGNGSIDCLNNKVDKNSTLKINCSLESGYALNKIIINGRLFKISSDSLSYSVVLKDVIEDIDDVDLITINIDFVKLGGDDETATYWYNNSSLPSNNGSYILNDDVVLSATWTCPIGLTNLDLNGHNIFINKIDCPVIKVANDCSILNITDSKYDSTIQYISEVNKKFALTKYDNATPIKGAIIGGAIFNNCQNSGAICVNNGHAFIDKVNIALNQILEGSGAAGIYVAEDGDLELGLYASVCFNQSNGDPTINDDKVAGAIFNKGKLISNASIFNNRACTNAVAGIYSNNAKSTLLQGSIIDNYAEKYSFGAINFVGTLDNSLILKNITVANNIASDNTCYPGIYVEGNVEMDCDADKSINISQNTFIDNPTINKDLVLNSCKWSVHLGPNFSMDDKKTIFFGIQLISPFERWNNLTWENKKLGIDQILKYFNTYESQHKFTINNNQIFYQVI